MFFSTTLLSLFLTALCVVVDATSLGGRNGTRTHSLNITTVIKKRGEFDIPGADHDHDRTLAQRWGDSLVSRASPIAIYDFIVTYYVYVDIGSAVYTLFIDTGSAFTWVGLADRYAVSESSVDTGKSLTVTYSIGLISGTLWTDTVTFGPGLSIRQQAIGVVSTSVDYSKHFDGILGLAQVGLTAYYIEGMDEVPTVLDNLFSQGEIDLKMFGICFTPSVQSGYNSGSLTFGGVDVSVARHPLMITYTPLYPFSQFWAIRLSITYGKYRLPILPMTTGIVDTGTTLLMLSEDAYRNYLSYTGAIFDETTGMLNITEFEYAQLESLFFMINGVEYEFTPKALTWPRSINANLGGNPDVTYLAMSSLKNPSWSEQSFTLGYAFLKWFCVSFDATNQMFGITENIFADGVIQKTTFE